jgi:hypothetical protein
MDTLGNRLPSGGTDGEKGDHSNVRVHPHHHSAVSDMRGM